MRMALLATVLMILPGSLPPATATATASNPDPFSEGSVWVGEARRAGSDDVSKWALTVTERRGTSFRGEAIVSTPSGDVGTYMVQGRAPSTDSGLVAFTSERKGFSQMMLRGKLENGEVALIVVGTGKLGKAGAGTATLKPKN